MDVKYCMLLDFSLTKERYHETHVEKVFQTAAQLLLEKGGLFILEFTVRFKSLATFISIISQRMGFIFVPISDFQMTNNNISANFSFKTLSMWKYPKISDCGQ